MYKALKRAKTLIAYEKDLLDNAVRSPKLRLHTQAGRESA